MRLNLGCGSDLRTAYVNVDLPDIIQQVLPQKPEGAAWSACDLSKTPWPWKDQSVEEILMHDFLEHFPYQQTSTLLNEAWRVLEPGGIIDIQVPDFEVCALAALALPDRITQCNRCGYELDFIDRVCGQCKANRIDIKRAAVNRLFGGQDRVGNWHFNAFTNELLRHQLSAAGFGSFEQVERNQNGETYTQNWNMRLRARREDGWE